MVQAVWEVLAWLLGLDVDKLNLWQMVIRSVVVYIFVLALTRLSHRRLMTRNSPFDFFISIALGTVTGNAILGTVPFFPALGSTVALVAMDWVLADLSFRSDRFGAVVKGRAHRLAKNGQVQWDIMRRENISLRDLMGAVRMHGASDLSEVKEACLERNGQISIVHYRSSRAGGDNDRRSSDHQE